jgi:hypothetical protein
LNDYHPDGGQYGGGLVYLLDETKKTVVGSTFFTEGSNLCREYSVGYLRKSFNTSQACSTAVPVLELMQTVVAPFGSDPVVVTEINITNHGSTSATVTVVEVWGASMLGLTECVDCQPVSGPTFADRWAPRRQYQKEQYATKFSVVGNGSIQLSTTTAAHDVPTATPTIWDPTPPTVVLAALDSGGSGSGSAIRAPTFGCNGFAFFGEGGAAKPSELRVECPVHADGTDDGGDGSQAQLMQRVVTIKAGATVNLQSLYGFITKQDAAAAASSAVAAAELLVGKYSYRSGPRSPPSQSLSKSSLWEDTVSKWRKDSATFKMASKPGVGHEVDWHYGYLRSTLTKYTFSNESILDQGTGYRYGPGGDGFEGAARDPLQHALPLLYTAPKVVASIIRFTLAESYSPSTWQNDSTKFAGRNLPYEIIGNGMAGPDGSPPYVGYNHLWRPSDLELYLLLTSGEYLLATKDAGFLLQTVHRQASSASGGTATTVLEALTDSYWFLVNHTGVGEHGLLRSLSGDWNDGLLHVACPEGLENATCVADAMTQGESMLNTAMATYVLPRFASALEMASAKNAAVAAKLKAMQPGGLIASMRGFAGQMRDAVLKQEQAAPPASPAASAPPAARRWFPRGWFPGNVGWAGSDDGSADSKPFLEPQPWIVLGGVLDNINQEEEEVQDEEGYAEEVLSSRDPVKFLADVTLALTTPVGALTADAPAGGHPNEHYMEGGAVWPAISHTLVWALAKTNASAAWDQWIDLSLTSTTKSNPSFWPGIWTSADAWGPQGINWQSDFPMLCSHRHAWPVFTLARGLMGLDFSATGVAIAPSVPLEFGSFSFHSKVASIARDESGLRYHGEYTILDGAQRDGEDVPAAGNGVMWECTVTFAVGSHEVGAAAAATGRGQIVLALMPAAAVDGEAARSVAISEELTVINDSGSGGVEGRLHVSVGGNSAGRRQQIRAKSMCHPGLGFKWEVQLHWDHAVGNE